MRTFAIGLALVASLAVLACDKDKNKNDPPAGTDDDTTLGEDGTDSSATETDSELLVSSLVAPAPAASGGLQLSSFEGDDLGTETLGDGAKAFFFPRGCLTTTADEAAQMVTYTFDKCAGPNGLYKITGVVKAHYTPGDKSITLDITGDNLTLNKATIDYHATATISVTGPLAREMKWSATMSGTTARGRELTRSVTKQIDWKLGEKCFTVSGTSQGDVGKRSLNVTIDQFTRCQGACPEAGGKITVTNQKDKTIEIDFDGTAQATVVIPNGTSVKVPLYCTE